MYRIDVQYEINVQVGKFLKNIKRAGQNRRAWGIFFSEVSISSFEVENLTTVAAPLQAALDNWLPP